LPSPVLVGVYSRELAAICIFIGPSVIFDGSVAVVWRLAYQIRLDFDEFGHDPNLSRSRVQLPVMGWAQASKTR
jgi:hypothetical protein